MPINKNHLSEEEIEVTQNCGTEPPFSGKLLYEKREGVYKCIVCNNKLFESESKFESGTGWPSFFDVIQDSSVKVKKDFSHFMIREEVLCNKCDAHLGHVFPDGPGESGLRYCINSISLDFIKEQK